MDELYNEVCDTIQEQYDNGDLTEEDATTLMEAAYDRYVVEKMSHKEEKDVIKAMTDKSKEFDAEITKLIKNGETRKAYHAATSAAKFFHDKQIELKDDLEAIKKKTTGMVAGGAAGRLIGGHFDKKERRAFLDRQEHINNTSSGDAFLHNTGNNIKRYTVDSAPSKALCLGSMIVLTAGAIQKLKGLPRKLNMFEQHFNKRAKIIKAELETSNNKK